MWLFSPISSANCGVKVLEWTGCMEVTLHCIFASMLSGLLRRGLVIVLVRYDASQRAWDWRSKRWKSRCIVWLVQQKNHNHNHNHRAHIFPLLFFLPSIET